MNVIAEDIKINVRPMQEADVDSMMDIEERAYQFPWPRMIFQDCLYVGYCCWILEYEHIVSAYGVMSITAGKSHILNLCVNPDYQSLGLGRILLAHLLKIARDHGTNIIFLEVRSSNFVAKQLYFSFGFDEVGMRHDYYPAMIGREDALILARTVI